MTKYSRIFNWQLYAGVFLVVIGGLFLADQLFAFNIMATYWPLLIVLFGLFFFVSMLIAGSTGAGLAIPGAVITTLGLLLFVQNLFDLWVTWTYAWSLLVIATGLGMLIMNAYLKRAGLRRAAGVVMGIGIVQFVVFGLLFEVILNIGGAEILSGVFLGAGLIFLGLFVVFSRLIFAPQKGTSPEPQTQSEVVDVPATDIPPQKGPEQAEAMPGYDGSTFTAIHFKSVGEVFLLQGDACDVRIEGDPDLVGKISTQVVDETLQVTYHLDFGDWTGLQWINEQNRLRYYLTVTTLAKLHMGGAVVMRAERLHGDHLELRHDGVGALMIRELAYHTLTVSLGGLGEVRLGGEVDTQTVELKGGGSYQALDLHSQAADVTLSGAGSAHVWVDSKLSTRISGAGEITYRGTPQVEEFNTGLGRVKPL